MWAPATIPPVASTIVPLTVPGNCWSGDCVREVGAVRVESARALSSMLSVRECLDWPRAGNPQSSGTLRLIQSKLRRPKTDLQTRRLRAGRSRFFILGLMIIDLRFPTVFLQEFGLSSANSIG